MPSQTKKLSRLEFAQKSKLTVLLHQLVRSYPKGVGIIHEFIQNADDAGASTVSIVLDERQHSDGRLPSSDMHRLQGSALVVVNDATFSDDDWERIQSTGRSGKLLDASKAGRFGLGFNSVYNVTDWPCILTRNRIGIFDPHGTTVEGASRDEPGAAWELTPELWEQCGDLLAPFEAFGVPPGANEIEHTVFRLPLRTDDIAKSSEICDQSFTRQNFDSLVQKLVDEAGELLLFLKHLTTITVRSISSDGTAAELLTIRTSNIDEVAAARACVHDRLRTNYLDVLAKLRVTEPEELFSEYEHQAIIERPGQEPVDQTWTVVQALVAGDDGELLRVAKQMYDYDEKAVPLVGAAALVEANVGHHSDKGRLFCTLPLSSVSSFLPFHINGFFDLQSDRQGIFADQGAEGKAAVRVEWNRTLLRHGCSEVAARLLARIATGIVKTKDLYRYWPSVPDDEQTMLQILPGYVYEHLRMYECIPCGSNQRLAAPDDVQLLPNEEHVVRQALLADDLPLANPVPPKHVIDAFESIESQLEVLDPKDVRDELRVDSDPACQIIDAPRQAIRSEKWIYELLRFCCSDANLSDLVRVPLAITTDGRLHAFGLCAEPLFIAGETERELLKEIPDLLLNEKIVAIPGFGEAAQSGIERVTPNRLVSLLARFLSTLDEVDRIDRNSDEHSTPSEAWLTQFYKYLADHAEDCDLRAEILRDLPLVPDQFGSLWGMGTESTPLLPSDKAQARLVGALKAFRVPVVDAPRELLKEIRRLVEARPNEAIWRITGRDLIDTLAAVKDEWEPVTQTYSSDLHGVLLSFLASLESRNGVKERADKLIALPIFPASDGSLVTLDSESVYLPAGYTLPCIESGLGFLDVGPNRQWLPLFESLKVPSLSRAHFIREVFLPRYSELKAKEKIELLQWLRTNFEEAYNELDEDDGRRLHDELCEAELVLCTDGKRHPGRSLYHPDVEKLFGELLGAGVGFPDMTVYSTRKDSWFRLFERLGMEIRPRAFDLLAAIDGAVMRHSSDPTSATESLENIIDYVQQNWADLRDVNVPDDPMRPIHRRDWTLLEALSERTWLPVQHRAPRGFPRELFSDSPPLLRRPDGLYNRDQIDLVSLVEPLSHFDLGVLGNDIGVRYSTDTEVTLKQLRLVLGVVRQGGDEPTIRKRTVSLFMSIYRQLGELFPPLTGVEHDVAAELSVIREEFTNIPCLVDEEDVLWAPQRVFASPVPFFLGRRTQVRSRNESIERGLEVLGRRHTPLPNDFVEFFNELYDEQANQPVSASQVPKLREAYWRAAQIEDAEGVLRTTCVLTDGGQLEPSHDVVIDDAEWLSERARDAGLLILDSQLDLQVAHAFGVTALSKAVFERPSRFTENHDIDFASNCDSVSVVVRSTPFSQGVRRLIAAAGFDVRGGDLNWLSELKIRPVGELFSDLIWQDGHEVVASSEGASDVLFDPDRAEIVASAQARDVLYERVAGVIAHELTADGYSLQDLSPLAAILRSEPDRVSTLLTRLRVPKFIDDAEVVDVEDGSEGGFIDDKERYHFDGDDEVAEIDETEGTGGDLDDVKLLGGPSKAPGDAGSDSSGEAPAVTGDHPRPSDGRRRNSDDAYEANDGADKPIYESYSDEDGSTTGPSGTGERLTEADEDHDQSLTRPPRVRRPKPGRSRSARTTGRNRRAVTYLRPDGEPSREQSEEVTERRTEVDLAAIEIVLQYERREGRVPEAKDHFHPGYDIESKDAEEVVERIIEVKGLSGSWNDFGVGVKPRQIEQCRLEPDRFWLYVVEFALEPERAEVYAIPNPVSLIDEYRFDGGWKGLSRERSGAGKPEQPTAGRRVRLADTREGMIESVDSRGALMRLTIRLDDGSQQKMMYAPSQVQVLVDDGTD